MDHMEQQNKKKIWKPAPRYMGVVASYNRDKGFGFIQSYEDGESYFYHISQFVDDVPERGMVVEFSIFENKKDGKKYCKNCLVVEYPERRKHR